MMKKLGALLGVVLAFLVVIILMVAVIAMINWLDPYLRSLMGRHYPLFLLLGMIGIVLLWGLLTRQQGSSSSSSGGDGGGDGGGGDGGGDGG